MHCYLLGDLLFQLLGYCSEERSQRQQWFRKGSWGNLEAMSYLPVLCKLMLFFVRLLPSGFVDRYRAEEESIHCQRKLCLTADLPGAATEPRNKGDLLILKPWTPRKFWISFGQVENLFIYKETKLLGIRCGDFFLSFWLIQLITHQL